MATDWRAMLRQIKAGERIDGAAPARQGAPAAVSRERENAGGGATDWRALVQECRGQHHGGPGLPWRATGDRPAPVEIVHRPAPAPAFVEDACTVIDLRRTAVLRAIRAGAVRHGTVAAASRLGGTSAYCVLDEMKADGTIGWGPDGVITITQGA